MTKTKEVAPVLQCMCFQRNTLLFLLLTLLLSPGLSVSPRLPSQQITLCAKTHSQTLTLPSHHLSCSFSPFSRGARRREHDRVRVSLQLQDAERQKDRHRFRNRHPLRLRPLLVVRQEINLFVLIISEKNSKKISCCRRGSKVALIAVATEAVLLWLALDCSETAHDWLRLGGGCESRTRLYAFVHMCFPSRRSAAPPGVLPSGRGSRPAGESETANYWKKKTWGLNYSLSVCHASLSLHLSPSPSLVLSFLPPLQPLSSLTSTTRRSSAALRVCRNTEPEAEVMRKDAVHSNCVIVKTAPTPKDVSMSN